jgi:bifunctional DNA-binding transcriptional regulator/antitoxin component of YhaV-PrlF toxin-antitoxin module
MSQTKPLTKLVRPLPKGQITLPIEFRRRLKIDDKTILSLSLKGSKIEILPLRPMSRKADLREYEEDEIQAFLNEDRLDPKTAGKVRRLLRKTA